MEETAEFIASDLKKSGYAYERIGIDLSTWKNNLSRLHSIPAFHKMTPKLQTQLTDLDVNFHRTASDALSRLTPSDPLVHLALARTLTDPADLVHKEAANAILGITESSGNQVQIQEMLSKYIEWNPPIADELFINNLITLIEENQ